jgi:hypothetical protein
MPTTVIPLTSGRITTSPLTTAGLTTGGSGYPETGVLIFAYAISSLLSNYIRATEIGGSPITSILAQRTVPGPATLQIGGFLFNENYNDTDLIYWDHVTNLLFGYSLITNVFYPYSISQLSPTNSEQFMTLGPDGAMFGSFFFIYFILTCRKSFGMGE